MENAFNVGVGVVLDQSKAEAQGKAYINRFAKGFNSGGGNLNSSISKPLGQISAKASEFEKSMGAANARVIAFGAATAPIFAIKAAFDKLLSSTIEVEKQMIGINAIFGLSGSGLKSFTSQLFNVANATGQSFSTASEAAQEFARQGLGVEETLKRTSAALILNKISGLGMEQSVSSLTSVINGFSKEALDAKDIIDRMTAVDTNFAVSAGDLAEALQRVGASASDANVSFNQTLALITAARQITGRDGSVIGNALKTIFTRLQRPEVLDDLEQAGVQVRNLNGQILPMMQVLKNLATTYDTLAQSQKSQVAESVGSVYQINILKGLLRDQSSGASIAAGALDAIASSSDTTAKRMEALNSTMSAGIVRTMNDLTLAASNVGNALLGSSMKQGISLFDRVLKDTNRSFDKDKSKGSKGLGETIDGGAVNVAIGAVANVLSGPGIQIGFQLISKLLENITKFGVQSSKDLLGLDSHMKQQIALEEAYIKLLQEDKTITNEILQETLGIVAAKQKLVSGSEISPLHSTQITQTARLAALDTKNPKTTYTPNLFNPVEEALRRENQATGGNAVLSSSPLLVSAKNPYGLAAIDKRNQKDATQAVIQHKNLGQTMSQIKSNKSNDGFIPNLNLYHRDIGFPSILQQFLGKLNGKQLSLNYGQHAKSAMLDDVRKFGPDKLLPIGKNLAINSQEIFEAETGKSLEDVTKIVLRRKGQKGLDQIMALSLEGKDNAFIKTVYHNASDDNHNTLDKSKYNIPNLALEPELKYSPVNYGNQYNGSYSKGKSSFKLWGTKDYRNDGTFLINSLKSNSNDTTHSFESVLPDFIKDLEALGQNKVEYTPITDDGRGDVRRRYFDKLIKKHSSKISVPNLFNPVQDALSRENQATGGHGVLSFSPLLVSSDNPYGLAAIDSRTQKDANEAIVQHKTFGQSMPEIKKASTKGKTAHIPNLANSLDTSLLLGLGGYVGSLNGVSLAINKWLGWIPGLYSATENEISAKEKNIRAYDKMEAAFRNGATNFQTFNNKRYNNLDEVYSDKTLTKDIVSQRAEVDKKNQEISKERASLMGFGFKTSLGSSFIGAGATALGTSIGGKDLGSSVNDLQSGITQAGQALIAFPTKIGGFLAGSFAASSIFTAIDTFSKHLDSSREKADTEQSRIKSLVDNMDTLSSTINNLNGMYLDATTQTETLINESQKYSEALASLSLKEGGSSIANRLQTAPDEESKIGILAEEKQKLNLQQRINSQMLETREEQAKKTFLGFSKVPFAQKNAGYTYDSDDQKDAVEERLKDNAQVVIDSMGKGLKSSLGKSFQDSGAFQETISSYKGDGADKVRSLISQFSELNGGGDAQQQLMSQIRLLVSQTAKYNDPTVVKARQDAQDKNAGAQFNVNNAVKLQQYLERLSINQGSLASNNLLDSRRLKSQNDANQKSLIISALESNANLFSQTHGERTTAYYNYGIASQKNQLAAQGELNNNNIETNRTLIDSIVRNIDEVLPKPTANTVPGELSLGIGSSNQAFTNALNQGLTSVLKGNSSDIISKFKTTGGQFDYRSFAKEVAQNSGANNKNLQSRIESYVNGTQSIDILKTLNASNIKQTDILQSYKQQSLEELQKLQATLKEANFHQQLTYLGGIESSLNRQSARNLERQLFRNEKILENPSASVEAKASASIKFLDALKELGVKADKNNPSYNSLLNGAEKAVGDNLSKMFGKISGRLGNDNFGNQIKGLLNTQNPYDAAKTQIEDRYKPEGMTSDEVGNNALIKPDTFFKPFNDNLTVSTKSIYDFNDAIQETIKGLGKAGENLKTAKDILAVTQESGEKELATALNDLNKTIKDVPVPKANQQNNLTGSWGQNATTVALFAASGLISKLGGGLVNYAKGKMFSSKTSEAIKAGETLFGSKTSTSQPVTQEHMDNLWKKASGETGASLKDQEAALNEYDKLAKASKALEVAAKSQTISAEKISQIVQNKISAPKANFGLEYEDTSPSVKIPNLKSPNVQIPQKINLGNYVSEYSQEYKSLVEKTTGRNSAGEFIKRNPYAFKSKVEKPNFTFLEGERIRKIAEEGKAAGSWANPSTFNPISPRITDNSWKNNVFKNKGVPKPLTDEQKFIKAYTEELQLNEASPRSTSYSSEQLKYFGKRETPIKNILQKYKVLNTLKTLGQNSINKSGYKGFGSLAKASLSEIPLLGTTVDVASRFAGAFSGGGPVNESVGEGLVQNQNSRLANGNTKFGDFLHGIDPLTWLTSADDKILSSKYNPLKKFNYQSTSRITNDAQENSQRLALMQQKLDFQKRNKTRSESAISLSKNAGASQIKSLENAESSSSNSQGATNNDLFGLKGVAQGFRSVKDLQKYNPEDLKRFSELMQHTIPAGKGGYKDGDLKTFIKSFSTKEGYDYIKNKDFAYNQKLKPTLLDGGYFQNQGREIQGPTINGGSLGYNPNAVRIQNNTPYRSDNNAADNAKLVEDSGDTKEMIETLKNIYAVLNQKPSDDSVLNQKIDFSTLPINVNVTSNNVSDVAQKTVAQFIKEFQEQLKNLTQRVGDLDGQKRPAKVTS
jgi:TP901 family phage tail tape measure protein